MVEIVCLLLEVLVRYRDTEKGWETPFVLKEAYDPSVDKGRHIQSWIAEFRFCSLVSSFTSYLLAMPYCVYIFGGIYSHEQNKFSFCPWSAVRSMILVLCIVRAVRIQKRVFLFRESESFTVPGKSSLFTSQPFLHHQRCLLRSALPSHCHCAFIRSE